MIHKPVGPADPLEQSDQLGDIDGGRDDSRIASSAGDLQMEAPSIASSQLSSRSTTPTGSLSRSQSQPSFAQYMSKRQREQFLQGQDILDRLDRLEDETLPSTSATAQDGERKDRTPRFSTQDLLRIFERAPREDESALDPPSGVFYPGNYSRIGPGSSSRQPTFKESLERRLESSIMRPEFYRTRRASTGQGFSFWKSAPDIAALYYNFAGEQLTDEDDDDGAVFLKSRQRHAIEDLESQPRKSFTITPRRSSPKRDSTSFSRSRVSTASQEEIDTASGSEDVNRSVKITPKRDTGRRKRVLRHKGGSLHYRSIDEAEPSKYQEHESADTDTERKSADIPESPSRYGRKSNKDYQDLKHNVSFENQKEDEYGGGRIKEYKQVSEVDSEPSLLDETAHEGSHMEYKTNELNSVLMLLKSFIGTGVLFLPKAFLNGGLLFSSVALAISGALSLLSYQLLIHTRLTIPASYGDMGGILYGPFLRHIIIWSIAISQIGFVSAYVIFTAQNVRSLISYVTNGAVNLDIRLIFVCEFLAYTPLVLIRNMRKLSIVALLGNVFILVGICMIISFDVKWLVQDGLASDTYLINPSWPTTLGTFVFTFEGIGVLIPIQESMKRPERFPRILSYTIIFIGLLLLLTGALSYMALGSKTDNIVLENLPQKNFTVNFIKLCYLIAILLTVPLQLFPVIRIVETEAFRTSGKFNRRVKWIKNLVRSLITLLCVIIAAVGAKRLDSFVSLVGSIACVPLVFIFPAMLHLRAIADSTLWRSIDISLIGVGVFVMIYSSVLTIMDWA